MPTTFYAAISSAELFDDPSVPLWDIDEGYLALSVSQHELFRAVVERGPSCEFCVISFDAPCDWESFLKALGPGPVTVQNVHKLECFSFF